MMRKGYRREAGSEGSEAKVRADGQEPDTRRKRRTSGQRIAKSISIKARSVDPAVVHRRRMSLPREICPVSPPGD